ncbi:MAG: hypothetical protein HQL43_01135 [Alphaproteobacteria bacterium]|jgi:hypothetical protein|nr:hypothetical protein [Alphaproteobacteria bacterium]
MVDTNDTESLRRDILADMGEDEATLQERFAPGTFGCHEALHMASVSLEIVDRHLLEHPAIALKPEWFALAEKAHQALFDLYQAIGGETLETGTNSKSGGKS